MGSCDRFVLAFAIAISALAACGGNQTPPQLPGTGPQMTARYRLVDLGTFGGPSSIICWFTPLCAPAQVLNDKGTVVGAAEASNPDRFANFCFDAFIGLPDCLLTHAFVTRNRAMERLDGFGDSAVAVSISDNDLITGVAQNGKTDPLVPGFPEVRAVVWQNG